MNTPSNLPADSPGTPPRVKPAAQRLPAIPQPCGLGGPRSSICGI